MSNTTTEPTVVWEHRTMDDNGVTFTTKEWSDGTLTTVTTDLANHKQTMLRKHTAQAAVAAFRRAGKRAASKGVNFHLSDPTCCRGCSTFPTAEGDTGPYVLGYRFSGKMNERALFTKACTPEEFSYLSWRAGDMDEDRFIGVVARALQAEGFTVTIPESNKVGIMVSYNPAR